MKTEYGAMFDPAARQQAPQPIAGLTSAVHGQVTGQVMEPRILRKKRTAALPTASPNAKEFVLLGQQGKFSANVAYKLPVSRPSKQTTIEKENIIIDEPVKLLPAAPEVRFNSDKSSPKKTRKSTSPKKCSQKKIKKAPKPSSKLSAPDESEKEVNVIKPVDNENVNNNNKDNQRGNDEKCRREDKSVQKGKPQTYIDKNLEHVMRYRAGLAPQRESASVKRSEYQKMFKWRRCERPTPVLAAKQVIYNSNTEMQPTIHHARASTSTEYRSQYKCWLSPSKGSVRASDCQLNSNNNNNNNNNNNEMLEGSDEPAGVEVAIEPDFKAPFKPCPTKSANQPTPDVSNQRPAGLPSKTVHEPLPESAKKGCARPISRQIAESPDSPVKATQLQRSEWASEYLAKFQPFTHLSYDRGISQNAKYSSKKKDEDKPGKFVSNDDKANELIAENNWFAEVRELREKAEEYRKRARGMHFSREHVGQLLATQAKLWDTSSIASSLSELVLDKQSTETEKSTLLSSASQHRPPESVTEQAGTHRLAWSCDGSRSTSESDTVRSIRSGHSETNTLEPSVAKNCESEQVEQKQSNSTEHEDMRSPSYVPAVQTTKPTPLSDRCDCASAKSHLDEAAVEESAKKDSIVTSSYSISPVAGKPTDDTHDLLDDTADNDDVLLSKYLSSPSKKRSSPAGMKPLMEGAAETYNIPMRQLHSSGGIKKTNGRGDKDLSHGSVLSSSMQSLASSSSVLARELLDKAEKRRTEFWATRRKPSRR